ncbi:hypothetical protein LPJ66_010752 [Kickxella alabastrina]|uniref:Uncharacterized protein n=1 Tax=Kickxella alabastrina TaxID=61397 RepID=A0ACC1HZN7_9FUNG|nr:hypothetical protein LPJ66_010752 [Kickxella alabastrina]
MVYRNARDQAVASADFAKLGHAVLQKRFVRACVYQLGAAYIVGVLASVNLRNGPLSVALALFSLHTLLYTAASYVCGVAVLVLHAQLFQVMRAPHGSHFPRLQRLLRSPGGTFAMVGGFVGLSQAMFVVHAWMFGGRVARLWLYPEGQYGPPQLNPAWLASWVLAAAVGAGYAVQLIAEERMQLAFPSVEQSRIHTIKRRLPASVARAFGFAAAVVWRFWAAYFVFGWAFYRAACGVLARVLATSSYGVGNPLLSASAVVFWLHSSTLVVLTWEFAHQLFEIVSTEPTHINELSCDRNLCLLNGLKHDESPMIQHLAYQELCRLTEFGTEQRAEILNDIDRLGGSMWSQVSAQCIAVIKTATSQLQAEQGAGADAKKTGGAAVLPPQLGKPAAEPIVMSAMSGGAPMMDILQQHRRQRDTAAGPKAPATVVSAQNLFEPEAQGLEKYVLTTLRDALLQSAVGQRILSRSHRARSTMAFANFQLQVWAVRSLMRLVEYSLEEDKYGVVQGDIAKVLETLFAYLAALEKCMLSVESSSSAAAGAAGLGGKGGAFNVQTSARQPWVMAQVVRGPEVAA